MMGWLGGERWEYEMEGIWWEGGIRRMLGGGGDILILLAGEEIYDGVLREDGRMKEWIRWIR